MSSRPATEGSEDPGATMLITHRVRAERHAQYERWLEEIEPLCRTWPGHLDWHILRPVKGLPETFTVVIRFDTRAHLQQWMGSTERARLLEKVRPLFVAPDDVQVSTGLDFWFVRAESNAKVPVRWKQYLMTWSAIYPLVLGVPLAVAPVLGKLGVPDTLPLHTLVITGVVVFLMVYVVMPRYTQTDGAVAFQVRTQPLRSRTPRSPPKPDKADMSVAAFGARLRVRRA